jgi:hypothetical protein
MNANNCNVNIPGIGLGYKIKDSKVASFDENWLESLHPKKRAI